MTEGGGYRALKPAEKDHWDTYKDSCVSNTDCLGETQKCTRLLWEAKRDGGNTFARGSACYNWAQSPCEDTKPFATVNTNYE